MTTINVSKDNHEQLIESGYGLFTKAGKEWMCRGGKQRIDWSMIEDYGNVIECHFGKFEFIEHNVKEKVHYWTLKNVDTKKYYEIKRDQVRNNKHLNEKWEIEYKEEVSKKEVEVMSVPKITELFPMPLLLTAPKSEFEIVREYVLNVLTKPNSDELAKKPTKNYIEMIKDLREEDEFILLFEFLFECVKDVKKYYRRFANIYHPDRFGDDEIFKMIQECYDDYK